MIDGHFADENFPIASARQEAGASTSTCLLETQMMPPAPVLHVDKPIAYRSCMCLPRLVQRAYIGPNREEDARRRTQSCRKVYPYIFGKPACGGGA